MQRRSWIKAVLVCTVLGTWVLLSPVTCHTAETNLLANGSFEQSQLRPGMPDDWACADNRAIRQELTLDTGRDGKRCVRLTCTEFKGDGPDSHVMICQVGKVSVRRGQWYRLTLWAKAKEIAEGSVEVALTNMRQWENAGLQETFTPVTEWREFQFLSARGRICPPRPAGCSSGSRGPARSGWTTWC
jgi:Carbohydrate binding domain